MIFVASSTLSGSMSCFPVPYQCWFGLSGGGVVFYLDAALIGIVATLAFVVRADSLAKWYGIDPEATLYDQRVPSDETASRFCGPCC